MRPLFIPLGFASDAENGWKTIVAILTGLIAKEMVGATMGVPYPISGVVGDVFKDDDAQSYSCLRSLRHYPLFPL